MTKKNEPDFARSTCSFEDLDDGVNSVDIFERSETRWRIDKDAQQRVQHH